MCHLLPPSVIIKYVCINKYRYMFTQMYHLLYDYCNLNPNQCKHGCYFVHMFVVCEQDSVCCVSAYVVLLCCK